MRIENAYSQSLEAHETLNASLNTAQGAQFSLMLSLMMAPVYSPDLPGLYDQLPVKGAAPLFATYQAGKPTARPDYPGNANWILVEDQQSRQLASQVQSNMGQALSRGYPAYFGWLRALTEEFPKLQFVTTMKPIHSPSPREVAAAYAAQARPDTETLVSEITRFKAAA